LGLGQIKENFIKNKLNMCNTCKYLTTNTRPDDGSISAKCKIKDINNNTIQTREIMDAYNRATGKTGLSNKECQFYYAKITEQCPGNPHRNNNN
jgi:hypothetical protein